VPGHEGKYEFGVLIHFAYKIKNYTKEKSAFSSLDSKVPLFAELLVEEETKQEKIRDLVYQAHLAKGDEPKFIKIGSFKIIERV